MNKLPDPFDPAVSLESLACFPELDETVDVVATSGCVKHDVSVPTDEEQKIVLLTKNFNAPLQPSIEDMDLDPFSTTPNEPVTSQVPMFDETNDSFLKTKLIDEEGNVTEVEPVPMEHPPLELSVGDLELNNIYNDLLVAKKISQDDVVAIESLFPGLIKQPLGSFSKYPSRLNYEISTESVFSRIHETILNGIRYVIDLIKNALRWIKDKLFNGVVDKAASKLNKYSPKDLRNNRETLLSKAKALDSQHGVSIVNRVVDGKSTVKNRASTYLYMFEWHDEMIHRVLKERYTQGIRLIVENKVTANIDGLKNLVERELTGAKKYLDGLNSTDINKWGGVEEPTFPRRELDTLVGLWGSVGKTTTTFTAYLEDYRAAMREAMKIPTSNAPHDFQTATAYSPAFDDMRGFCTSVSRRLDDLVTASKRLENKVSKTKEIPSTTTGRFSFVTERISFIQNLMGIYRTIYNQYSIVYALINRPLIAMGVKLDAIYKQGKVTELIKQHT